MCIKNITTNYFDFLGGKKALSDSDIICLVTTDVTENTNITRTLLVGDKTVPPGRRFSLNG